MISPFQAVQRLKTVQLQASRVLSGASKRRVSFLVFKITVHNEKTVSIIMRSFYVLLSHILRLVGLLSRALKPLSAKTIILSFHCSAWLDHRVKGRVMDVASVNFKRHDAPAVIGHNREPGTHDPHDIALHPLIEQWQEQMIVLADKGFKAKNLFQRRMGRTHGQ